MEKKFNRWLLKTEPGEWSWDDQEANGGMSKWDGVKNKQAQKYMKAMSIGDMCFFYHSGTKFRRVVGVVEVVREWYEEGDDGGAVDVKAVGEMRTPVGLGEMKKELRGAEFRFSGSRGCRFCRWKIGFGIKFVKWGVGMKKVMLKCLIICLNQDWLFRLCILIICGCGLNQF